MKNLQIIALALACFALGVSVGAAMEKWALTPPAHMTTNNTQVKKYVDTRVIKGAK